eukprot:14929-Heterococcus_DN1.PRE.1
MRLRWCKPFKLFALLIGLQLGHAMLRTVAFGGVRSSLLPQSRLAGALRRPVAVQMAAAVATKAKARKARKPKAKAVAEDEEVPAMRASGSSKLVIVESPAKARTIQHLIRKTCAVEAPSHVASAAAVATSTVYNKLT